MLTGDISQNEGSYKLRVRGIGPILQSPNLHRLSYINPVYDVIVPIRSQIRGGIPISSGLGHGQRSSGPSRRSSLSLIRSTRAVGSVFILGVLPTDTGKKAAKGVGDDDRSLLAADIDIALTLSVLACTFLIRAISFSATSNRFSHFTRSICFHVLQAAL